MKQIRPFLIGLGFLSLALGFIGIFVPLFPTTCFVLFASFLFYRSSPKFHHWLEHSRLFGPYLSEWHAGKGFSKKRKKNIMIFQGVITLATLLFVPLWLAKVVVIISFVGISLFLAILPTVPEAPREPKETKVKATSLFYLPGPIKKE